MAGIPVYCPNCGALFLSRFLTRSLAGVKLVLEGNKETCPRCGHMANVADGEFEVTKDAIALISGPQFTKDMLRAFGDLIEKTTNKSISVDELEKQAAEIDPQLGKVVAQVRRAKWPLAALVILGLMLKSCNFNFDLKLTGDLNQLWDQIVAGETVVYTPPPAPRSPDSKVEDAHNDEKPSKAKPPSDRAD